MPCLPHPALVRSASQRPCPAANALTHHRCTPNLQERLRPYDARIISSQILPLLVGLLRSMLATLQPRAIATITYSLASLDVRDKELLAELAGRAEGKLSEFTSQGLSNMLWAFARSELQPPARWMEAYLGVCHAKLGTFSAQELATLMWSLSKLKYKVSEDKLADFLSAAHTHMPKAQPQSLAMFAYSLGAMEQRPGEGWLDALVTAMLRSPGLARFTPQGLSQTLWALSRLDYQPSPVLAQAVCRHLSSLLSTPKGRASYKGIDLATTMYSMARMRMHVPGVLYSRLLECLRQRMLSLDPTHVANSCWALACFQAQNPIRYPNHEFWLAVFSAVHVRLERFNPHDLAMLAWALARLDVPLPEPFLMSFQRRVEQVRVRACMVVVSACVRVRVSSGAGLGGKHAHACLFVGVLRAFDCLTKTCRPTDQLTNMPHCAGGRAVQPDRGGAHAVGAGALGRAALHLAAGRVLPGHRPQVRRQGADRLQKWVVAAADSIPDLLPPAASSLPAG